MYRNAAQLRSIDQSNQQGQHSQSQRIKKQIKQNIEDLNQLLDIQLSERTYIEAYFEALDHQFQSKLTGRTSYLITEVQAKISKQNVMPSDYHWHFRFLPSFCQSILASITHGLPSILNQIFFIIQGYVLGKKHTSTVHQITGLQKCHESEGIFLLTYDVQKTSYLYKIGIQKFPELDCNGKLIAFRYVHMITFIEMRIKLMPKQLELIAQQYISSIQSELMGNNMNLKPKKLQTIKENEHYLLQCTKIINSDFYKCTLVYLNNKNCQTNFLYQPTIFQPQKVEDGENYIYDTEVQAWITQDLSNLIKAKREQERLEDGNKYLIQRYADFKSAGKLAELLQSIPNFKVKMTDQEKEIISTPGNILVIGRSGTGKTTCAILRLFAMNMLFKLRVQLLHNNNTEGQIDLDNPDNALTFRTIFVTASPVLAYEVKKYYKSLKEQLEGEINKKRMRLLKQKQENGEDISNLEQSTITMLQQAIDLNANDDKQQEEVIEQIEMEDDNLDAEEEFVKEMGAFEKITDIKEFPAFLTLRKLLLMIDAQLYYPFFKQGKSQNTYNKTFGWHNENSGTLMLNGYSSGIQVEGLEDDKQIQMEEQEQKTNAATHQQAKEVTYEVFKHEFWPQMQQKIQHSNWNSSKHRRNQDTSRSPMSPSIVWTEIFSVIKGSQGSYSYDNRYLSAKDYTSQAYQFFKQDRDLIYELFLIYEKMKTELKYYDLLDMVNYIITQINKQLCNNVPIHYLILDEVQDLPETVFVLLEMVVEHGIFFSGDTAQNIAKGIGFRFSDLKMLLANQQLSKPLKQQKETSILKLNVNFRSHNNILQLANSVVCILELLFPKMIDKLKKERSDLQGPKPIIINDQNIELLVNVLTVKDKSKTIEFGSSQVIIVKDQQSKKNVPENLQHAMILTIYEAKGLEFDDVILFNFFTDNYIGDKQWQALDILTVNEIHQKKEDFEQNLTHHESLTQEVEETDQLGYKVGDGNVASKRILIHPGKYKGDTNQYIALASEIKLLYVAITRPKKRLIIYDQQPQNRKYFISYLQPLGLVDIITDQSQLSQLPQLNWAEQATKDNPSDWKRMGVQMFRKRFYFQSAKCFAAAGELALSKKANAYLLVTEATKIQFVIQDTELEQKSIKGQNKRQYKLKIQNLQQQKLQKFIQAADIFQSINHIREAAQCYFSAELYEQALNLYVQANLFTEAGEASFYLKQYQKAAEFFLITGDTIRALDCLQLVQNWDKIFDVLQQFKDSISFDLRVAFINKLFPKILDQLTQQIEKNPDLQEENFIIQEAVQDEEQDDDEEEELRNVNDEVEEEEEAEVDQQIEVQDNIEYAGEKVQIEEANIKQQESQEMEILQEEQSMNEQIEFIDEDDESQSFIVQNVSQAKSASLQVEEQENADHLSFYDPDDQWLNSERFSVVESIMSKASEQSDFSAVMLNQVENNPNIQLIKTKVNIYIQDQVIQELIKYMLMFQEEFKVTLEQQRSKSQQLSGNDQPTGITNNLVEFMLDMDQIDIPFVHKMLDILEQYQSYKLCIFVCNKYKLADKLGRYLVSIAANYTPFQRYLIINPNMITNSHIVKQLSEQTQLASFAVHNVLEYINPEFLRTKYIGEIINEFNDLGQESFQALIHLGYWKKAVFAMDYMNAIEVFIQFQDWRNALKMIIENEKYQIVNSEQQQVSQLNSIIEHIDFPDQYFTALNFETPKTETQFLIVKLSLCQFYQFYMLKLISINKQVNKLKPQLGQYYQTCLPLTAQLLDFVYPDQQSYENLSKIIHSISDKANLNGTIYQRKIQEIEIPLVAQCLLQILSSQSQKQLIEQLTNKEFQSFLDILIKLIRSKAGSNQEVNKQIMYALSITTNHKLFPNHQYYGLVHKTSPLMNNLTKINPNWSQCFFNDINFEFVAFPKQQIEEAIYKVEMNYLTNLVIIRQGRLASHYDELNVQNQLCITPIEHNFILIEDQVSQMTIQQTMISMTCNIQKSKLNPRIGLQVKQVIKEDEHNQTQWLVKPTGIKENKILLMYEFLRYQLQLEVRPDFLPASLRYQMIVTGIRYLKKAEQSKNLKYQHKNLIKGILILHYCNQSQLSIITLQKIEKKQIDTYSYLKYIEMLECQHYSIIYDSMQCYFEYHENTKMLMFDDELYGNLSRRVIHQIIGFSLFTKDSFILKLPEELAFTLYPMKLVGESQYQLRIPITPIDNLKDLDDLCYIIMEYIQTSNSIYVSSFTFVLIMVILNVEKLSPAIKDCINKFELYFKNNPKVQGITKVQQLINKTLKQRQEALLIDYELQYIFQQQQFYVDIEVQNTLTLVEQEQQYNQCLQKWSSFDSLIVRLKTAVNTISKYYTQYKQIKNNKQTNKQLITQISSQIDQFYKLITCNQFNFQQSVDYHFIQQQFKLQKKYHLELNKLSKLNTDDIKLLEEIIKQTIRMFEEWINQQTVAKHNSNILELNRRQIAQKWLNRKAGIRIKLRK